MPEAALVVHGGAGRPPRSEYAERDAAVRRALDAGWSQIGGGALAAVVAAVRHMEDEAILNAGIGACLNSAGEVELDAGAMEGSSLRVGAVGAVRDVRHPVELARCVLEDGRHVLLVAGGASAFARERGIETCDPALFVTDRQRRNLDALAGDTVGAVAVDAQGRTAVAVSTGGIKGKLPGRIGDSPLAGAGFYADDRAGAVCGTGQGEAFIRLCLSHRAAVELERRRPAATVAEGAVDLLASRLRAAGGIIVVTPRREVAAAFNTPHMAWAARTG